MPPPLVSWRVPRPVKKHLQALAAFSEAVAMQSAIKLGYDKVEIRAPPPTTRRNGNLVKIQNHLTLNWLRRNKDQYELKKHGELFVDDDNTRMLEDNEIDENTKALNATADDVNSNPHTWGA